MTGLLQRPIVVAAGAAILVAVIGGSVTQIGPWYEALEKPALNPPNWVFAPAWTIIYALCVIAAATGWRQAATSRDRSLLISVFFFNAVFNIAWSVLFFGLQRPDWALAEVGVLWISVLALILLFLKISRPSALLLLPYLAWVGFAAWINFRIVALNGPFG